MTDPKFPLCERAGLRVERLDDFLPPDYGPLPMPIIRACDIEKHLARLERERNEVADKHLALAKKYAVAVDRIFDSPKPAPASADDILERLVRTPNAFIEAFGVAELERARRLLERDGGKA